MPDWKPEIRARLAGLNLEAAREASIVDEISQHLDDRFAESRAGGASQEEAWRSAVEELSEGGELGRKLRRVEGPARPQPVVLGVRSGNLLRDFCQDFLYGLRMLRKTPGFTAVTVITLALGIGASTAIYSVVNTLFWNPVPGPEPDRLIEIGERTHGNKDEPMFGGVNAQALEILRTKREYFSDVVWMEGLALERKSEDFIEIIYATAVSSNFFAQWDIKPILGRTFSKDEAVRLINYKSLDRDTVMVVSHSFWQSRFGGQTDVLGKTIEVNGRRFTIIGVMPKHFQFPRGASPTCWIPVENPNPIEQLANIHMFARLKPGVSAERTQAMLDTVTRQMLRANPALYDDSWHKRGGGFALLTRPLRQAFTQYASDGLQRTLFGLLGAIGFVLLISCVNVANLMLARTERRQQEFAVRAALGARRARLMRQVLTESLLLAGFGALAGLAVTVSGMRLLVLLVPEHVPRLRAIHTDGRALGFTLLVSIGTVLAFGLLPAWHASRTSVGIALKRACAGATVTAAWRRYRSALVVVEVALSVLLLTGAGLMIESVIRLLQVNPGFAPDHLLFAHPGLLRGDKYYSDKGQSALYEDLREQFAALPGVKAVGISKIGFFQLGFLLEGQDKPVGLLPAGTGVGDGDLFRAMRVPLVSGRHFDKTDVGVKMGTVIVNESMARLCWPGENALSKRFRDRGGRDYEVVGVVGDARIDRYDEQVEPTFYRPYQEQAGGGGRGPFFAVRTETDPRALIPAIRDAIRATEPSMTTPWFQVVRQTLYDATEVQRTYMLYLVMFAGVGLLLSALGIYGVLACSVARRTREIGIRMAVGAAGDAILRMVMVEGARLVLVGVGVGLLAAFWLTRLLQSQLFKVSPNDPVVMAEVVLVLCAVSALACWLPARRAARLDPMEALRCE
jgi:predicted permease